VFDFEEDYSGVPVGRTARRRQLVPNSRAKADTILERVTWSIAGECGRSTLASALDLEVYSV
jgi:hypothetical protein